MTFNSHPDLLGLPRAPHWDQSIFVYLVGNSHGAKASGEEKPVKHYKQSFRVTAAEATANSTLTRERRRKPEYTRCPKGLAKLWATGTQSISLSKAKALKAARHKQLLTHSESSVRYQLIPQQKPGRPERKTASQEFYVQKYYPSKRKEKPRDFQTNKT